MKPINVEKLQRSLMRKWRKVHDERAQAMRDGVCEWTQYVRGDEPACNPSMTMYEGKAGLPCPRCNRPIKFKEAAR